MIDLCIKKLISHIENAEEKESPTEKNEMGGGKNKIEGTPILKLAMVKR